MTMKSEAIKRLASLIQWQARIAAVEAMVEAMKAENQVRAVTNDQPCYGYIYFAEQASILEGYAEAIAKEAQ
jgi:hypothetical protein